MTVSAKVFHSIYIEKGFELVTRDNADSSVTGHKKTGNGAKTKSEPASVNNSTAELAARLGLTPQTDSEPKTSTTSDGTVPPAGGGVTAQSQRQKTSATNAESDVASGQNEGGKEFSTEAIGAGDLPGSKKNIDEDATNSDSANASAERESNKRDRGRG